jgi:hypothetical protein
MGVNGSVVSKASQSLLNVIAVGNIKTLNGGRDDFTHRQHQEWLNAWSFGNPSEIELFITLGMKRFRKVLMHYF